MLRSGSSFAKADLRRARLVALDLHSKTFVDADLTGANLTECDLSHADLRRANLWGAALVGAVLNGADLTGASLRDAYLLATDFGNARLDDVDFSGAIWDQSTQWPPGFDPPRAKVGNWHGADD